MKLIQKGNSKLPGMYMFNLPANKEVCNRTCKGCYAAREEHRWPSVANARQQRYEATLQPMFRSTIKSELLKLRTLPKHFRIHSSGEFYSQQYVNDWHSIASSFPQVTFYAYTKRLRDFDFTKLQSLPNVVIIDSFHFGGLNYGPIERAPTNAFICPEVRNQLTCGVDCTWCQTKGKADKHGVFFKQH